MYKTVSMQGLASLVKAYVIGINDSQGREKADFLLCLEDVIAELQRRIDQERVDL